MPCDRIKAVSLWGIQGAIAFGTSVSVCEAWCEAAKRGASLADRAYDDSPSRKHWVRLH
jgi:hypothetical protein